MRDSVKEMNRLQTKNHDLLETCSGKVERLNASDWSIFHWKPQRNHLIVRKELKYFSGFSVIYSECPSKMHSV